MEGGRGNRGRDVERKKGRRKGGREGRGEEEADGREEIEIKKKGEEAEKEELMSWLK